MRDEYHARSPDRTRDSERSTKPDQDEDHSFEQRQDGYRSRQDSSRSPPRQPFSDDRRGRDSRYRDSDVHYDREYDEGYGRRGGASRGAWGQEEYDYSGMYDDCRGEADYGRERYGDEGRDRSRSRYRDGRERTSGSRSPGRPYRSRSHSPMRDAGKPSDTVILEGLPFNISSSELRKILLYNTTAADFPSFDVRVAAAKGHRRAFIQFEEVGHAVSFMREHYPKLFIELAHSTDDVPDGIINAYIHYARTREARDEMESRGVVTGSNWECPTCDFSNYSTRTKCKICGGPPSAPNWQQSLTGATDAANGVPSQLLVIYPLAPFVTEEILANGVKRLELEKPDTTKDSSNGAPKLKSTAPIGNTAGYGARPGSLHRVFLMRDTNTNDTFKYGFAEFWTLEDAAAAVTKFQKSRAFTVADNPVTVSTIHMGVFVPEDREITPEIERMSFHPLFNRSIRVRYRDYHVYPSQQIVTSAPPDIDKKQGDETGDGKKSKKRKAEGGPVGSSVKKQVPMAGQLAKWQRKADELREPGDGLDDTSNNDDDRTPVRISLSGNGASAASKPQGPIKISISGTTKLGGPPDADHPKSKTTEPAVDDKSHVRAAPGETTVSYVDRERLMCLICMRKYKSVDEVNIHEKSRNHKNATENEEQVQAALPRLAARDKRLQKQVQEDPDAATSQYRDRAKERRQAYSQPTKPAPGQQHTKPKQSVKQEVSEKPAKPAQSKGAGMLAKMGWSAGSGLGANNDGRTEVVATNAYQEGVGLGAEGGNLGDAAQIAERKTKNSYTDYLNTVQDKARERYSKMS